MECLDCALLLLLLLPLSSALIAGGSVDPSRAPPLFCHSSFSPRAKKLRSLLGDPGGEKSGVGIGEPSDDGHDELDERVTRGISLQSIRKYPVLYNEWSDWFVFFCPFF